MSHGVSIALRNVSLGIARSGLRLLSDISLDVESGQFVGILGPSGAGKSTLLHVMNGDYAPTAGEVTFDGLPTNTYLNVNRRRLAYLPQAPILHEALTPHSALSYTSRLRGLSRASSSAPAKILAQLGIANRSRTPIRKLSGGEKKRVALAAELLGDPLALFLDEATSGLDPATEKEMMELFLRESQSGKTVICITHFPDNVSLCDKLIVLARGSLIFFGTPREVLSHFQIESMSQLYPKLVSEPLRFQRRSEFLTGSTRFAPDLDLSPEPVSAVPGAIAQTATLTVRYAHLLLLDFRNLSLLLLQAPLIALFIGATFGNIAVDYSEQQAADFKQVAFLLIMGVLWCAGTNGVREIVKERPLFLHERRYGLSDSSYFSSKLILLGLMSVVQAFLLLALLGRITHLAGDWVSHCLILSLLAIAATAAGLCISALSETSEQAMTFLPVILIALAVLSGGLARLQGLTKWPAWLCDPAFWTLEGLKATLPSNLLEASFISAPGIYQPLILGRGLPYWSDVVAILRQIGALISIGMLFLRRLKA